MLKCKQLILLTSLILLSSCDIIKGLSQIDLANVLFESHCGDYYFDTKSAHERCGAQWGSFGFYYEKDKKARILLSNDDKASFDYTPVYEFWFDNRYLKSGQVLNSTMARASCSRFKPELDNGDPTYFVSHTENFKLEIIEFKGEQTDEILDDKSQWVFKWEIECSELVMSANGQDQIDLNRNPIPSQWSRVGLKDPPDFKE